MKTILLTALLTACSLFSPHLTAQLLPEGRPDTITGTSPVFIVYSKKDKPLKAYQMTEDCYEYCRANMETGVSNQQVNLHYGYPSDSIFWQPSKEAILEDYMHPVGLTDEYLEVDTVWVVMQEHFPIADRAYTRFRQKDCYEYANNNELQVIKLPYYKRCKRSYERIMDIKRRRLGIKKK